MVLFLVQGYNLKLDVTLLHHGAPKVFFISRHSLIIDAATFLSTKISAQYIIKHLIVYIL